MPGSMPGIDHIAMIGNALPRRCGLATYTSHVVTALNARFPDLTVDHYAMDDGSGVEYPSSIHTIPARDPMAYREAAGLIEASGAQAIWVQHEFGIFGGDAGAHLMLLLERSTLPVVATLHTVLESPSPAERTVFERLLQRAGHLIVMAQRGRDMLCDLYDVAPERISVIEHGVPDRPYVDPDKVKARYDLSGRPIIMTFGLLAPDKGIDYMIEAMPAIVAEQPNACYVVIGATHPNLVREQGEAYRESLVRRVQALGIERNVRFIDSFLEEDSLLDWLEACDVYVTPYLNLAQVTSGTLSYAVALGKPVVSTPYIHAREILADDHGVIVSRRDSAALAKAVEQLLGDASQRGAMAARAYARGREMIWPKSAERGIAAIAKARRARVRSLGTTSKPGTPLTPNLEAVERMTDGTGILQHGIFSIPDRNHGYCVDDNARALILTSVIGSEENKRAARLSAVYAAFLQHAWNPDLRRFRNFMRYDRSWCEDQGSQDSNGRALWALGHVAAKANDQALRDWAIHLFDQAAPLVQGLESPRAIAFAALGAAQILTPFPAHGEARAILERAGDLLDRLLAATRRPDWSWFEAVLAYDNARLCEALIRAGSVLNRDDFVATGIETLDWILDIQTNAHGLFRPVGTDSFNRPYSPPLPFDQQPLEAQATIEACLAASDATGDSRWANAAHTAYRWYLGHNDLAQPLASRGDGGCFDGLMPHGVNRNQGAESILALQLANVAIASLSDRSDSEGNRNAA
ncbi:glycosyltransferase family 4 protein [Stakelama sp. CBK3Z-3]|uniref:Glycosyltransferase family 4 protein n=1 Tax=Stakelama flava TaxID=2860338 RepID=A0ABS6XK48_9SPHN|nr:glycosyltransferase family 4 protein [Stakelama flava]MBW4329776.1 glycosyltransferase family 4 protein [Stakelama flava]